MTTKKLCYSFAGIIAGGTLVFGLFFLWIVFKGTETKAIAGGTVVAIIALLILWYLAYLAWKKYNKNYVEENGEKKN